MASTQCFLAAVFVLVLIGTASGQSCYAPTVTIQNGTYAGVYSANYHQEYFLGMPFAQPPVHDLRFANPVSLNSTWAETRNATEYGPYCPGYEEDASNYNASEYCLTINVVRPAGYQGQQLPVATWIYGGGYFAGGSSDPRYNLSYIVANSVSIGKPMIAVSMNYRVAGWGFLKSTTLVNEGSTNMGMRDQRLALHWIQENIEAFGGDPTKVTIWGESAGAFSVGYHLIAYGGRDDGLFRSAIAESGNPLYLGHPTWSESQPYYDNVTEAVGCANTNDTLACLRAVPFETLDGVFSNTWQNIFFPQPDGDFIQGSTLSQLRTGAFVHVPLLIGTNTDEGTAFLPTPINTDADLASYITSQGPDNATAAALLLLYPDIPAIGIPSSVTTRPNATIYGAQYKRGAAYNGEYYFIAGRRFTAVQWAAHNASAWSYRFDTAHYTPGGADFTRVTHGAELAFVFANTGGQAYDPDPFADMPPAYFELAGLMSRMWVAFVVDGNPNGHGVRGVPEWPWYMAEDGYGENMVFVANSSGLVEVEGDTFRAEAISYLWSVWDSQYGY